MIYKDYHNKHCAYSNRKLYDHDSKLEFLKKKIINLLTNLIV